MSAIDYSSIFYRSTRYSKLQKQANSTTKALCGEVSRVIHAIGHRQTVENKDIWGFYHFEDADTLYQAINFGRQDASRFDLHECVLANQPRKPCLDLDIDSANLQSLFPDSTDLDQTANQVIDQITQSLLQIVKRYFHMQANDEAAAYSHQGEPQAITFSRNRPGKYSAHVIVWTHYVSGASAMNVLYQDLVAELPHLTSLIDSNITKSSFNMSLPYSKKNGLTLTNGQQPNVEDFKKGLLTYTNDSVSIAYLSALPTPKAETRTINSDEEKAVIELFNRALPDESPNHRFRNVSKGIFNFDRVRSSYCDACEHNHDTDNTLRLIVSERGIVYMFCQKNSKNKRLIGRIGTEQQNGLGQYIADPARYFQEAELTVRDGIKVQTIHQPQLPQLPIKDGQTLVIRSEKGIGKTVAVLNHIAQTQPQKVGYISFRRTLAHSFKVRTCNLDLGFAHYQESKGAIYANRWICQLESINRLAPEASQLDLLILDEINPLIRQLFAKTVDNPHRIWRRFELLVRSAKQIVVMDADISDKTLDFLKRISDRDILVLNNTYVRKYTVEITDKETSVLHHIEQDIKAGRKVCITSNRSAAYLHRIGDWLRKIRPDIKLLTYSSEDYVDLTQDVNQLWLNYDCVLYSPTIQAGVSFEQEYFDTVYGLFCNMSNLADDCSQMFHRVRATKRRIVYIKTINTSVLPCDRFAVQAALSAQRAPLMYDYTESINRFGQFEYVYINTSAEFATYVDTLVEANLSKTKFVFKFMEREYRAGAQFKLLESADLAKETAVEFKKSKAVVNEVRVNEVATANVDAKTPDGQDTNAASMKKHLMHVYDVKEAAITPDFVRTYSAKSTIEQYYNRCVLREGLQSVYEEEKERFEAAERNKDSMEFLKKYRYSRHLIATTILKLTGFTSLNGAVIAKDTFVSDQLPQISAYLSAADTMKHICQVFNKKASRAKKWDVKSVLQFVNPVLDTMYGFEIKANKNSNKVILGYVLVDNNAGLFDGAAPVKIRSLPKSLRQQILQENEEVYIANQDDMLEL